jgi:hypothetical protein
VDRRAFGYALGATLIATRCGGGGGGNLTLQRPTAVWNLGEVLLVPGTSFDLKLGLPADVPRNGRFKVADHGAALAPGIVLLPDGELRATPAAQLGSVSGVIFEYDYD